MFKMRIVIDARESGTSTGRYIDKLIEYLHKIKTEEEFVVLTKPHRLDYMKSIAPSYTVAECPIKEFTFAEQVQLLQQINGLHADLVHFGMVQQPVLYRGRVVTTMHDLTTVRFKNPDKNPVVFTIKQQIYKWVNKHVAKKSGGIIVPTQFVKDDVINFAHVSPKKIVVTYEAADKITIPAEPVSNLAKKQFIMYVGRPTPHKNLWRLIEAFGELKSTYPDLQLVLAGKKDHNYTMIERRVINNNLSNIIFTDFISDGQLRWLYENCAAYVVPSLSEGFGLPGLEAMIHGAPVISSNATCLPEVYGKGAAYFDPLDVHNMAAVINEVLTNQKMRKTLIEDGLEWAKKYSWQTMAQQTLAIYKKTLR